MEQEGNVVVEYRVMPPISTFVGCVFFPIAFSAFAWYVIPLFIAAKTPYTALFQALHIYTAPVMGVGTVLFFLVCVAWQFYLRRGGPILKYERQTDIVICRYDRCSIPKRDVLRVMSVINHYNHNYYHEVQVEALGEHEGNRLIFVGAWAIYAIGVRKVFEQFCTAANLKYEKHGRGIGPAASE